MQKVLVCGAYLADRPNHIKRIVAAFAESRNFEVTQRWASLLGEPPTEAVADVTVLRFAQPVPKFQLVNQLLAGEDLSIYEYVIVADDDVVLAPGFVDGYIERQAKIQFALAQPSRTLNSSYDHSIVRQQPGVLARETLFVEIGPVFSIHRSAYELLLPFAETSPMGWGYETVWAATVSSAGLKMGIVDAYPVDHSLREVGSSYAMRQARREQARFLAGNRHLSLDECFVVKSVAQIEGSPIGAAPEAARISVVIGAPTDGRSLRAALDSLAAQSTAREDFEVIVVATNVTEDVESICDHYRAQLQLRYFRINSRSRAAAKNLGLFLGRSPVVLFYDERSLAGPDLLAQHLRAHAQATYKNVVVVGRLDRIEVDTAAATQRAQQSGGGVPASKSAASLGDGQQNDGLLVNYTISRSIVASKALFDVALRSGAEDEAFIEHLKGLGARIVSDAKAQSRTTDRDFDEILKSQSLGRAQREAGSPVRQSPAYQRLLRRGVAYYRAYGAGEFLSRGLQVWKWLPNLVAPVARMPSTRYLTENSGRKQVLMIGRRVPFFDTAGGYLREYGLIQLLVKLGLEVTYLPDDVKGTQPYTWILESHGVHVMHGAIDPLWFVVNYASRFACVVLEEPDIGEIYAPVLNRLRACPVVYDSVDLHYLREGRRAAVTLDPDARRAAERYHRIETELFATSDAVIAITDVERDAIYLEHPDAKVYVVSNMHHVAPSLPGYSEREGLVFIGNFQHLPNLDAVSHFSAAILPAIRKRLGDIPIKIVGNDPDGALRKFQNSDMTLVGWVPDVAPYLQSARVLIAPLRYGAGIKGKITEAMAYGLPSVTTATGAEGFTARHGEELLVAEDDEAFIEHVVSLYADEALWRKISSQAYGYVDQNYSFAAAEIVLRGLFADLGVLNPSLEGVG